jgi:hypothetical protein
MTKDEKKYGSRKNPRPFLTAEAAVNFCKEEFRPLWVRLPMYRGKFHIWPGGRKEFWPDPCTYSERNP